MIYWRYGFNKTCKAKPYKKWISALSTFIVGDSSITMKLLRFINDTYKVDSMKNITRQKQGTSFTKFNITGFEQNIPQGNNWKELFNDLNRIFHKVTTGKSFSTTMNTNITWSKWQNSMYWSLVPEICQDLLLLLFHQEENNIFPMHSVVHSGTRQRSLVKIFAKSVNFFLVNNYLCKKVDFRYLTGSWMSLSLCWNVVKITFHARRSFCITWSGGHIPEVEVGY